MKKGIALLLAACMALSACGAAGRSETGETARIEQSQEVETQTGENRDGERTSGETAERAPGQEQETEKILIAYFTWADNTQVEDPSAVDVDATTSASVLPPGNTAKLAEWIQERVGGDLFSIVTEEPYSSDYDQCLERAADEKAEDARPALTGRVEHMEQYDTVFLGYPNWWYTVPMPVLTFLEAYDFPERPSCRSVPTEREGWQGVLRPLKTLCRRAPGFWSRWAFTARMWILPSR